MASCSSTALDGIADKPHQPKLFRFPQREFGKTRVTKRSFQPQWFDKWRWLHYIEEKDLAFCHTCLLAHKKNQLHSVSNLEQNFISTGFHNWKDATAKFSKHESSQCHKEAVLKIITLPTTTGDVGEMMSSQLAKQRLERRKCLLKLLSNVRFLSRQGLPLRGDGKEMDSNFMQLLTLRSEDVPDLAEWVMHRTDKYTSPEMQNEMIAVMAKMVLRKISQNLQHTTFYTIMVDETTDVSNVEQVVICLRWVSEKFEVHEDFVCLYEVESTEAARLHQVIIDVFLRLNLSVSNIRGQCYDGASAMSGKKSGVVVKIQEVEPRAVFTHCYGHALNLACADTIKRSKLMKDALDVTYEITKLVKKSPRRDAIFKRIKEEMTTAGDSGGIRVLCPTRWTVRAEAFKSILENFNILLELWDESLQIVKDTEMKARILGVQAQMKKFDYFFGVSLGLFLLRHTDNLSKTMQKEDMCAAEAQHVMSLTLTTLKSIRNDVSFNSFWQRACASAQELDVNDPALPRRRKAPCRIDDGTAPATFPETVEDHYRALYFEALDLVTSCISDRFDQPGYKTYGQVEALLLKAATSQPYDEELKHVLSFYGSDFDSSLLSTHLEIFSKNFQPVSPEKQTTVSDIVTFFQSSSPGQVQLMHQVGKLMRLLLVMPATNAQSERSFSAVRRIKSYLRSSMSQKRLNHLMLLHIHKSITDKLDMIEVANNFKLQS